MWECEKKQESRIKIKYLIVSEKGRNTLERLTKAWKRIKRFQCKN